MRDDVRDYVEGVDERYRPLFDRLRALVLATCPDASESLSYGMPTYRVGKRRLHLGVWAHGVSVYGWKADQDGGFLARHPSLLFGKATIRLRPADAAAIPDDEFRDLVYSALGG